MHPREYQKLTAADGVAAPGRDDAPVYSPNTTAKKSPKKDRAPPAMHVEPVLTTIRGAGVMLGLGGTSIRKLVKEGKLRAVKFGPRRVMVVVASIHEMIAQMWEM